MTNSGTCFEDTPNLSFASKNLNFKGRKSTLMDASGRQKCEGGGDWYGSSEKTTCILGRIQEFSLR
jgi:hypothetical protein